MKDYLGNELKVGDIVIWGETSKNSGVTMTWGVIVKGCRKLKALRYVGPGNLVPKYNRCEVTLVHPALYNEDMKKYVMKDIPVFI